MGKIKDITGQRFGKLTAVERTGLKKHSASIWKCICDCGNETLTPINYLTTGDTKSCGCMKWQGSPKDVAGQRFNKLTAVKRTERKSVSGDFIWFCECECGGSAEIPVGQLNSGAAYSCGCQDRRGTHNMSGTPTYTSWLKLLARTRHEEYAEWYSDVEVCDRWDSYKGGSFENFYEDMGERPAGTSINRVNGSKIYSRETCEWASYSLQGFDQRKRKTNTSGRTGVRWREERKVWEARIGLDSGSEVLYYGSSFEEAVQAREDAELKYHGFIKE